MEKSAQVQKGSLLPLIGAAFCMAMYFGALAATCCLGTYDPPRKKPVVEQVVAKKAPPLKGLHAEPTPVDDWLTDRGVGDTPAELKSEIDTLRRERLQLRHELKWARSQL